MLLYATTPDFKSFEAPFKGGYFTSEVYKYLKKLLENQRLEALQGVIATSVNQNVIEASRGLQTPESVNKLRLVTFLLASDRSKYQWEIGFDSSEEDEPDENEQDKNEKDEPLENETAIHLTELQTNGKSVPVHSNYIRMNDD